MTAVSKVWAREILDSRGLPTVEAVMQLDGGATFVASVPAGTSTGTHEAVELRDKDETRYLGKEVLKAVENVNKILGPAVIGMDPTNQQALDTKLIELDGTENKSKLGANSILAVSILATKAAAGAQNLPPYRWVEALAKGIGVKPQVHAPTPIFNMINGGLHGAGNLDFQEFFVIPATSKKFGEGLRMGVEIYVLLGDDLERRGAIHSVGIEGGYAPNLFTNGDALEIIVEAIRQTQYQIGRDVFLGLDVAADTFYKDGQYSIRDKSTPMDDNAMQEFYKNLNSKYHLAILEDPFYEDGWDSWKKFTETMKDQLTIVGDDLLATNPKRLEKGIQEEACNAILVKPNQIGTVSETLDIVNAARAVNWKVIVSHRSGETNDWFIADFASGVGADYVKFGAPARGERVAKYNRLLSIDAELHLLASQTQHVELGIQTSTGQSVPTN